MATKIRLQRHGRKSYAFYSIVIAPPPKGTWQNDHSFSDQLLSKKQSPLPM